MIKLPISILFITAAFFYNDYSDNVSSVKEPKVPVIKNLQIQNFRHLRDTVYTLKQNFIVVNLAEQKAFLYSRNEPTYEFGISSGTEKVRDGVETNEGLFVIQAKLPEWHSQQFDSTLLLYWIGFNHGIGFHALAGNSYYKYLGVKKSSHGCLRISREDARHLYARVEKGTPVLLHRGNSAVFISFADSNKINSYVDYSYSNLYKILPERFNKLYEGRYFVEPLNKILIERNNVHHNGLPIGDSKKIPEKQLLLPGSLDIYYAVQDNLRLKFFSGI